MGKIAKLTWITLSLSLIIIYVASASYINTDIIRQEKKLTQEALVYENKKNQLNNQQVSVKSLQNSLLIQLSTQKTIEGQKLNAAQLAKLVAEQQRLQKIAADKALMQQQAKQAALAKKAAKKKKTRAS